MQLYLIALYAAGSLVGSGCQNKPSKDVAKAEVKPITWVQTASSEPRFEERLRAALGSSTLSAHRVDGPFHWRGYSVKWPFGRVERMVVKLLEAGHITYGFSDELGLHGAVRYKSGVLKEVLFHFGAMKIGADFLGIDGTEKTWSNLVITTISRRTPTTRG
jgi:hypothetical protein